MGYFNTIERYLAKIRRRGFFVYTAFIVASTAYLMYAVSNMPSVPPPPPPQVKDNKRQRHRKKQHQRERQHHPQPQGSPQAAAPSPAPHPGHPVDTWTKRELYRYLTNENIYPDINEELEVVRRRAMQVYESKLQQAEDLRVRAALADVSTPAHEAAVAAEREAALAQAAFAASFGTASESA